ncbi:hypothetical protein ACHAW6_009622 [Cyclotella cf. meneghiniana]
MSPKQTPLKFSAGGSKIPKPVPPPPPPPSRPPPTAAPRSDALSVLSAGLSLKRSPFHLQNWIACLLTLDGRDKFTKALQYACRLLAWHFGGLASSSSGGGRAIFYESLSRRFRLLYQSFVESRKAFRMGRGFIEYDKLRSMGWGEYWRGVVRASPVITEGAATPESDSHRRRRWRYRTHSIPEHHDEDASEHGQESWNEDDDQESDDQEEKKVDVPPPQPQPVKIIARPGRPHLPSRVSSNIGWGPGTDDDASARTAPSASARAPPSRTLSDLKTMYRSTRTSSMGWIQKTTEAPPSSPSAAAPLDAPPAWKIVGTTLKLLGLMGFWTFDNLAFLTGTGFLDPPPSRDGDKTAGGGPESLRMRRKTRASEWGARFYFAGALAGLGVNLGGIWEHRMGALRSAREEARRAYRLVSEKDSAGASSDDVVLRAKQRLKAAETKLFELYVALLKSICDCIVFSNNPGVDLHLKFRGRKNHEGLHCCCGLISAGTVLFGNFPNA